MQIIILAAGKGSRLMPLTKNKPKPLVELEDGRSILERQVELLDDIGAVEEVIVVVGYKGQMIEDKIEELGYDEFVEIVYNPFYDVSDNLHSFWLGLMNVEGDFAITNGDNLFNKRLLHDVFSKNGDGIYLTIDHKEEYVDDDMKVSMQNGVVNKVSKDISQEEISAESIGLGKIVGKENVELVKSTVNELIKEEDNKKSYWLELYNDLLQKDKDIKTIEVNQSDWFEMDIHSDKEIIDAVISKNSFFVEGEE